MAAAMTPCRSTHINVEEVAAPAQSRGWNRMPRASFGNILQAFGNILQPSSSTPMLALERQVQSPYPALMDMPRGNSFLQLVPREALPEHNFTIGFSQQTLPEQVEHAAQRSRVDQPSPDTDSKLSPDVKLNKLLEAAKARAQQAEADPEAPTHPAALIAYGEREMLCRPCVVCGRYTGNFCDGDEYGPTRLPCLASKRVPTEQWVSNQRTPLCNDCEHKHGCCHFCRSVPWCMPFPYGPR